MSNTVHSMDTAFSRADVLRNRADEGAGRGESDAFSRLLGSGQADGKARAEEPAVPAGGKDLPDEQTVPSSRADTDREAGSAGDASAQGYEEGAQESAGLPREETEDDVVDPSIAQAGTPAAVAAVTEGVTEQAEAGAAAEPRMTVPAGQETAASEMPDVPGPDNTAVPGTGEPDTTRPMDDAVAALRGAPAVGGETADAARSRPAPDVLGQAVREGIMQRLAAADAQGDAGDALTGGGSGQSSAIVQFTGTRAAAAGVISFSDALLETGSTLPSSRIAPPVGQPAWGRAVGEQVVWFVGQNIHSASLKLNPQHLGPLELQLHVDGDKASIAFASQHAVVRDALESSLARLRDLLAEQGLNLVNVNISHQDAGGRRDHATAGERNGATLHASGADEILLPAAGVTATGAARGLVDYYV